MKKISAWILRAIMLGVIVLGALLSGPQPLMAQDGSIQYFEPSQESPIHVDCGNGELYDWSGGKLPVRPASMEVEAFPGRWCSMVSQTPDWVSGAIVVTIIAVFLFFTVVFVFRWRMRRQNSDVVCLNDVFNETIYYQ